VTPCADPDALCRRTLDRQLALAAVGRHRLRVPEARGLMRPGAGRHHHFTPETFFQISGRADFDLPYQRFPLLPDEVCLMPVGMPHRETVSEGRAPFRHLVVMFTAGTVAWHLKEFCTPRAQPRLVHPDRVIATPQAAVAMGRLAEVAAAARDERPGAERLVQGAWLMYLALLRQLLDAPAPATAPEAHRVTRCRHLVMRRLADPRLSVPALARELNWSPNHLSHRFHRETGTPLVRWIERERMAQARGLLASTSLGIKEIAARVGHPDASYFARVFRRFGGLTPSRYREQAGARDG
jgi:AraC-like DNA-binding protein